MDLTSCCKDYYVHQARTGSGYSFPVYTPSRGDGFFGDLFRSAVPFLKNTVAPKLIKGAASVATDLLKGRPLKESLVARAKEAVSNKSSNSSNNSTTEKRKKISFNKKSKRNRYVF